ncbi:DNA-binding transcriptional regulator, LysR family [Gordonia malaquae]|uniref:Putative LysR family transcriptional regulator n=1 Tax=Gordonia malaquae NBRC 108250 TaxID=1223542 RepID=M3TBT4_GORML|nr:LysR family transcriptional regulator [Gordonia malaquae]GAC78851.1 putative LysR family transcriptional regulator [Gordonia malaquae NBRC 108250]SEB56327.1 DNA-binding transcriptional regulator, LysR family [Gordonia malaquae]
MLNVARLRVLRELHLRGTLAAVADALSYTPSAVSQQLSQLEKEAGVQLLEKVGRGVRLTDQAITLVGHTEAILARLELAESELAAAQPEVRGVLRVASFQSVVLELAPAALTLLAERHPLLQVEITQRDEVLGSSGLLAHEFDVVLGEEFPGGPHEIRSGIDREDLLRDPLLLAMPSHGPLADLPADVTQLADAPWALDPADLAMGAWSRDVCRSAGFEPDVRFDTPDPLLQAHLVRSGHAVALLPSLIADAHLHGTRLASLPGNPHRRLYTAARAGRSGHPSIRAFRSALAHAARG